MYDILLHGAMQTVIRRRWWLAVISGAIAAFAFVTILHFTGLLPS